MALTLYFHPLSSFCHKVLIALYENGTPFTPKIVNLMEENSRAEFLKLWPIGKFPVLHDDTRDRTMPETSIIIEYLDTHYPGRTRFIPQDAGRALQTRLTDRLFDLYMQDPMQKIVGDRLRPAGSKDAFGVAQARARIKGFYDMVEKDMAAKTWAMGDEFTLADCAAGPALFYANWVEPFPTTHKTLAAYHKRLTERPSYKRALAEAEPYFEMFPKE
jgi:glutathione S-transferase